MCTLQKVILYERYLVETFAFTNFQLKICCIGENEGIRFFNKSKDDVCKNFPILLYLAKPDLVIRNCNHFSQSCTKIAQRLTGEDTEFVQITNILLQHMPKPLSKHL